MRVSPLRAESHAEAFAEMASQFAAQGFEEVRTALLPE